MVTYPISNRKSMYMAKIILDKYAVPNQFVHEPFGTVYQVFKDDKTPELYIQLSHDINFPRWEPMGAMLEKAFADFIDNDDFVQDCLKLYLYKESQTFLNLSRYIKDPS